MAYFSLLTHRETELTRFQRVPHFDSLNVDYFALVHYLNPGNFGGTGFFRHRPTGFERLTQDRFPQFTQAAEGHFRMHGEPAAQYIRGSDDHFELIATMNYRPNRIIAYLGNLSHSGIAHLEQDIDANPVTGRLTANLFSAVRLKLFVRLSGSQSLTTEEMAVFPYELVCRIPNSLFF